MGAINGIFMGVYAVVDVMVIYVPKWAKNQANVLHSLV